MSAYCKFQGCRSLTHPIIVNDMFVRLPEKYKGSYSIPNGIKRIINGAFDGCCLLTHIEIPDSVTVIGDNTFSGCSSLTSVEIPVLVTKIADGAFRGLRLKEIHLRAKDINSIGLDKDAFKDVDLSECSLYIHIDSSHDYKHHPFLGQFKGIFVGL